MIDYTPLVALFGFVIGGAVFVAGIVHWADCRDARRRAAAPRIEWLTPLD
jgi:hypothetical protein